MNSTLQSMPATARLWVYQADRAFTDQEEQSIREFLNGFVSQWAAHGQQLVATFEIMHHQFIVLAVDESKHMASGCSIDASVDVIRQIEQRTGLNLLDRSKIAFFIDGKVELFPMIQVKDAVTAGTISEETEVFNNAVSTASDWKENWVIPAKNSWLQRYF